MMVLYKAVTLQCAISAHWIVTAKADAVGITEIKFAQVAVQVLLAAMLVDALHAALEN
jgi:hypothetical protein